MAKFPFFSAFWQVLVLFYLHDQPITASVAQRGWVRIFGAERVKLACKRQAERSSPMAKFPFCPAFWQVLVLFYLHDLTIVGTALCPPMLHAESLLPTCRLLFLFQQPRNSLCNALVTFCLISCCFCQLLGSPFHSDADGTNGKHRIIVHAVTKADALRKICVK